MQKTRIRGIQFHLKSAEEIKRRSVASITETTIYKGNVPKPGGVSDPRLGTNDRRIRCATCNHSVIECPGHEGHIEMPPPVALYHPFFLLMIVKLLRSVCYFCSRLHIVPGNNPDLEDSDSVRQKYDLFLRNTSGIDRFNAITKLSQSRKQCKHCQGPCPTYMKEIKQYVFTIKIQWKEERFIMNKFDFEDLYILYTIPGFSKIIKTCITAMNFAREEKQHQEQLEHQKQKQRQQQLSSKAEETEHVFEGDDEDEEEEHLEKKDDDNDDENDDDIEKNDEDRDEDQETVVESIVPATSFEQLRDENLSTEQIHVLEKYCHFGAKIIVKLWQDIHSMDHLINQPTVNTSTETFENDDSEFETDDLDFNNNNDDSDNYDDDKTELGMNELNSKPKDVHVENIKRVLKLLCDMRRSEENMCSRVFTSVEAYNIVSNISVEDAQILGFNGIYDHPRNWFITQLDVPPLPVRPTVTASEGSRSKGQNDLTKYLIEILKSVNTLKKELKACPNAFEMTQPPKQVLFGLQYLQYNVTTYMNNEQRGLKMATSRNKGTMKSLSTRIIGKKGRIRGNLMGKRVDFSARTVITPDPALEVDEVGVPEEIALILTKPEIVTPYNIEKLTRMIRIGFGKLQGAHSIDIKVSQTSLGEIGGLSSSILNNNSVNNGGLQLLASNRTIYLQICDVTTRKAIVLEYGSIVHRYLRNGDLVLINRQPTLHRQSIMAHRVRIMAGKTFRLNLSVTTPYNADFDGDEMNLHVPQNDQAIAELRELVAVHHQILNAQNNKPTMGLVQDALAASYIFTCKDVFLTRVQVMDLIMHMEFAEFCKFKNYALPQPAIVRPRPLWTGKQVYSLMLPSTLQLSRRVRNADKTITCMDIQERLVIIRDGNILCGSLCKQTLGTSAEGIVHVLAKDNGTKRAADFMTDAQRVMNNWFASYGFSVGISDCVVKPEVKVGVQTILNRACEQIGELYSVLGSSSQSKHVQSSTQYQQVEDHVSKTVNDVINKTGKYVQTYMSNSSNRLCTMVTAASKGSNINISQTTACVGQQSLEGARIRPKNNGRTLPRFLVNEETPESRGLIKNSYIAGLTPYEFFFHAMAGREGLVDTAVKTSQTGYIQRRLIKSLEAMQVRYDETVSNAEDYIVEFCYGGDCVDAKYLESVPVPLIAMSTTEVYRCFGIETDMSDANQKEIQILLELQRKLRYASFSAIDNSYETKILTPVHVERVATIFIRQLRQLRNRQIITTIRPDELFDMIKTFVDELYDPQFPHRLLHFETALRCCLTIKAVCFGEFLKMSRDECFQLLKLLRDKYHRSKIEPGDMVGPLASESIGHPSTQLTLNTFHSSGIGAKNVTLGIPRLREIIDVTKNMKTPSATIYMRGGYRQNKQATQKLANTLGCLILEHVVQNCSPVFEPDLNTSVIRDEEEMMRLGQIFVSPLSTDRQSHWVIRFELNRKELEKRDYTPYTVAMCIRQFVTIYGHVLYSCINAQVWSIRVIMFDVHAMIARMWSDLSTQMHSERTAIHAIMLNLLKTVKLGGISEIQNASVRQVQCMFEDPSADNKLVTEQEYVIDTVGTDLRALWMLDVVDWKRTISNELYEIYEILGIEAAIQVLRNEINRILSFDGTYVNVRHIALVVSTMTFRGYMMPLSRHGINKIDTGVTQRASFEESMDILTNAAAFGEYDPLKGATENIMVGQLAPIGTGSVNLVMRPEYKLLMQHILYNRRRENTSKLKIFKSCITEWNQNNEANCNIDNVVRPPSPAINFNFSKSSELSSSSLVPKQSQLPLIPSTRPLEFSKSSSREFQFVPDPHDDISAVSSTLKRPYESYEEYSQDTAENMSKRTRIQRAYIPESPEIDEKDANLEEKNFTRLVPKYYYPESPVIEPHYTEHGIISDHVEKNNDKYEFENNFSYDDDDDDNDDYNDKNDNDRNDNKDIVDKNNNNEEKENIQARTNTFNQILRDIQPTNEFTSSSYGTFETNEQFNSISTISATAENEGHVDLQTLMTLIKHLEEHPELLSSNDQPK